MPAKASPTIPAAHEIRVLEGFAPVPEELRLEHGGRVVNGRIAYRLTGCRGLR